jgi:hypothetical protein
MWIVIVSEIRRLDSSCDGIWRGLELLFAGVRTPNDETARCKRRFNNFAVSTGFGSRGCFLSCLSCGAATRRSDDRRKHRAKRALTQLNFAVCRRIVVVQWASTLFNYTYEGRGGLSEANSIVWWKSSISWGLSPQTTATVSDEGTRGYIRGP